MDHISTLVGRHELSARVFYNGEFCGSNNFTQDGRTGHLHLVRNGPIIFRHDDKSSMQIDVPTLVFYPRGKNHQLVVPANTQARLLCATIAFQGGGENLLAKALPECVQVPLDEMKGLTHTLELLFNEAATAQRGQELILDRLCDVLIVQLIRHVLATGQLSGGILAGLIDPRLSRALSAIHDHPGEPWRLESLASLCGMSRSKFAEYFQSVVGIAPGEYLAQWRIGVAQVLLKRGKPVKTVSAEVGYSSQPAFTRAFTERTGLSPRAWLTAHGNG